MSGPRPRGLASSRARFQRRAVTARRRPWVVWGYAVGALAVVVLLVWVVAFSPLLAVARVEVVGVPADEVEPIRAMAKVPTGQPLVYELDAALRPLRHYYLGDAAAIEASLRAVAAQGRAAV